MYKTKNKEGKEKRREEAGGAEEVLIGRGSGNSGANRQTVQIGLPGNSGAYRQTVQIGLPSKVCDLCQICNWARTVTVRSLAIAAFWFQQVFRNWACSPLMLSTTYSTGSSVPAGMSLVAIAKALEVLCNNCVCQEGFHFM